MSASIEVINSLEQLSRAVKDVRTAVLTPSKPRNRIERAKQILKNRLRCGLLKSTDLTKERLMYEQGFTEAESIEILDYLLQEDLLNGC